MIEFLHKEITEQIIESYYKVYNQLGYGFLEKVYENALCNTLKQKGLVCEKQKPISVYFENEIVGEYFADLVVENKVIVEIKSVENLCKDHENQLIHYLKATKIEVGLLINFGRNAKFIRRVFSN